MRRGIHTIRSGFRSSLWNPTAPREHLLDNGNYKLNMKLVSVEFFPISNSNVAGVEDKLWAETVFFVVGTTSQGATPLTTTAQNEEWSDFGLRPSDSRQIAWGVMAADAMLEVFIDPEHILTENIYVNAYQLTASGALSTLSGDIGYMLKFTQVDNTAAEGLLFAARDDALQE